MVKSSIDCEDEVEVDVLTWRIDLVTDGHSRMHQSMMTRICNHATLAHY